MSFDDLLADLAPTTTETLGEQIVIVPPGGAPERTILAIVDRSPPEHMDLSGKITRVKMIILVNNNTTSGIASGEFDKGGTWKAKVALKQGGEVGTFGIYQPPPGAGQIHDGGHIEFHLH